MATTRGFRRVDEFMRIDRGKSAMPLSNGSRVAVVGAGPAGSMFSYFLLNMAESMELGLEVDLYEPRNFSECGLAGCNNCGGVISESLVQHLATEGIALSDHLVQTGIDSYTLHTDVGHVRIGTPQDESRIAAIYRGSGPKFSEPLGLQSLDGYLERLAIERGARLHSRLVTDIRNHGDTMKVECADGCQNDYELVAIASGVNSRLVGSLHDLPAAYEPAELTRTFICEFHLGREAIQSTLGQSMHVFLLDLPRLMCAALIPKGDYVTLCLLGEAVEPQLVDRFLNSPEVSRCFPGGLIPPHVCHCFPRMNVRMSRPPYGDRLVMVGDCGTTRLFKDGIGAAYRTAKAAARTAVFHGVSAEDFRAHYWPLCASIEADNRIGKMLFRGANLLQRTRFARRAVLRMVEAEQRHARVPHRMSSVLWDLFSGSAPYTDVFMRILHPGFFAALISNLVAANCRTHPASARKVSPEASSSAMRPEASLPRQPWLMYAREVDSLPPCEDQCPNGGDIRRWLGIIAQREKPGMSIEEAYDRAWNALVELNPFPATLGRICPHPCERHCSREPKDGAVSINAVERFLGDWGLARRLPLPRFNGVERTESIGVVGAGPAGLSFAYQMARRGYPVTIYERQRLPGGLLRHAVPDFRLPREVIDAEVRRILDLKIRLVSGVNVGQDVSVDELKARHRVLFIGIGAQSARTLGVEGETGPGVLSGIEYLARRKLGIKTPLGRRVVVIGAGDTAIDSARSARRDGADVTLLYRRSYQNMPAAPHAVREAAAEHVGFDFLSTPRRVLRSGPIVTAVEVQRLRFGDVDEEGRPRLIPIPGSVTTFEADTILVAASQQPDWRVLGATECELDRAHSSGDGRISANVWAGGDDLGPGIAIRAVAQGRQAAEAVHAELRGEAPARARMLLAPGSLKPQAYDAIPRTSANRRPAQQWLVEPELEIDQTITSDQALKEADRCMSCGLCFGCDRCVMYCNVSCFARTEQPEPDRYHEFSQDLCEGCGRCIELCPCGYLSTGAPPATIPCAPLRPAPSPDPETGHRF